MKFTIAIIFVSLFAYVVAPAQADTFGSAANTFDIEFVSIGNPGNVADTTGSPNPAGSVDKTYRIGKYEVSEQMIDKANTLGGLGITKDTRGPDKPATNVSWNAAARFINWLNTSTGSVPAYKFAIQPGEVGYNSNANVELWDPADEGYNPNNLYRNSRAKYFLPSVDEWYKAAYFDPNSSVYYDYPTGSDSVPDGIDFAGDATFDAVFFQGASNLQPNNITNVGVLSPYGTAGQGGNVREWEETDFDLVNGPSSSFRAFRGGYWNGPFLDNNLRAVARNSSGSPVGGSNSLGFRVASIPEPSTALFACASLLCLVRRKRLR